MNEQEGELTDTKREELRGLFTLGLMAILITLRVTQNEIIFYIFGQQYNMIGVIDVTLMFWGLYVLLMILWLSNDWLPKNLCDIAYQSGIAMLALSFALFYITLIAMFSVVSMPWHLLTYLLLVPLAYLSIKIVVQTIKTFKLAIKTIRDLVKKHLSQKR